MTLDPQLKQMLADALKKWSAQQPVSNSFPWGGSWGMTALLLLILAAVVATLVLAVRERPATAAPLGAAGLAAAAIEHADHLSRLDPLTFWFVLSLLISVIVILLVIGFMQLGNENKPTDDESNGSKKAGKDESETGGAKVKKRLVESPLNIIFSVAVLLWAMLVVCYRAEPKPASPNPPTKQTTDYKMLNPITGFIPGMTELPGSKTALTDRMQALIKEAADKGARPGDTLLLLGSADCTAIRKRHQMTNKQLAQARADVAAKALSDNATFAAESVKADSLHQNDGCAASADLRSVVPILLEQQSTE